MKNKILIFFRLRSLEFKMRVLELRMFILECRMVFGPPLRAFRFFFVLLYNGADKALLLGHIVHSKNEFLEAYKFWFKSHKKQDGCPTHCSCRSSDQKGDFNAK